MLDVIRRMFDRDGGREASGAAADNGRELHIAACALLLELAHSDREFSAEEMVVVEEALVRHFGVSAAGARELMAIADQRRREAPDLHQFTSEIIARYDEGQRMVLTEVLWRVVYADGTLSRHEDYLMQKLARLLDLRPGYLAEARKKVRGEST
jgi:uncharacterized tellurite resistance protein B-like protein